MTTETTWAELRERIQADRDGYYENSIDHAAKEGAGHEAQAARYDGRVAQCDDLLAAMDRLEAGQ